MGNSVSANAAAAPTIWRPLYMTAPSFEARSRRAREKGTVVWSPNRSLRAHKPATNPRSGPVGLDTYGRPVTIEFRILGPLEVAVGGTIVPLPARQQRVLLSAL